MQANALHVSLHVMSDANDLSQETLKDSKDPADGVEAGLFLCSHAVFPVMEQARQRLEPIVYADSRVSLLC